MATMSGGGVSGECEAAVANGRGEGAMHMSRTSSVYSACMQDDKSEWSHAQSGEVLQVMSACSKVIAASTVHFNSLSLLPFSCRQSVSSFTG